MNPNRRALLAPAMAATLVAAAAARAEPGAPPLRPVGNIVDILSRGGVGDGSTDNAAAFRALFVSNTTIIVPAGTYVIKSTIAPSSISNFCMILMPGAVIKHDVTLVGKLFLFSNCDHIRFTSLGLGKIDVSTAPNSVSGTANDAISYSGASGSTDCEVDHIHFYSGTNYLTSGGDSHIFLSGSRFSVHDCIFEGAFDLGVYISGPNPAVAGFGDALIRNNRFIGCANASLSKRLFRSVIYEGNTVTGGLNGFGSTEADTSNLPGTNNTYIGNTFIGLASTGSAITSHISTHDLIENNRFIDCQGVQIGLQGTTKSIVKGNIITIDPAVYVSPSSQYGVSVGPRTFNSITYNSDSSLIEGNTFDGVYYAVREVDASQSNTLCINNTVSNAGISPPWSLTGTKSFWTDRQTERLQGVTSGYAGSERVATQVSFQSTAGAVSNVFSISVSSNRCVRVTAEAIGNTSGVNGYGGTVIGTYTRAAAGNVTLVGATTLVGENSSFAAGPTVTLFADTASQVIRVRITGLAGTTINWVLNITYTIVATNA